MLSPKPTIRYPRKAGLQQASEQVMQVVRSLVPPGLRPAQLQLLDERFGLRLEVRDPRGQAVPLPEDLSVSHAAALSKLLYGPAILRIFARDLHFPVGALRRLDTERDPTEISEALQPILGYLENHNPRFLTYRFGREEGSAMEAGLRELDALARWSGSSGCSLSVTAVRRCRLTGKDSERVETSPGQAHAW